MKHSNFSVAAKPLRLPAAVGPDIKKPPAPATKPLPNLTFIASPGFTTAAARITPPVWHLLNPANAGLPRAELKVPVSPAAEATDQMLFEAPGDASKKYYLPRYRMRQAEGRYEIGVTRAASGNWRLEIGLERYPAPGLAVAAATEMDHEVAAFIRYRAGPANTIERRVAFTDLAEDAKGLKISVDLELGQRDAMLMAFQTTAAAPQLIVRRTIDVAVKIGDAPPPRKIMPLVFDRKVPLKLSTAQPARLANKVMPPGNLHMRPQPIQPVHPVHPAPHEDRYRTTERTLDDTAEPDPFVLDPAMHGYLYQGLSESLGAAGGATFSRISLAYPEGADNARFHAYFQDRSEPWKFYFLPDSFKLARSDTPPCMPQMVMRIAAPDGDVEKASVTVDYVVRPWVQAERLSAAAEALKAEVPAGARHDTPELGPLQAAATLQLWIPGASGSVLSKRADVTVDLANGFADSLTLPLTGFRTLFASGFSRNANSLFSGQVAVETGLGAPDQVPVEIRFADTAGDVLGFQEHPSEAGGTIAVTMTNQIESSVTLTALPVEIHRGNAAAEATLDGLAFDAPLDLAPNESRSFTVRPKGTLGGTGEMDAVFDTSGIEVKPDPDTILPLISDTSVPAEYERQIEVMTMAELLGDASDPASILLINAEFRGGDNVKLNHDTTDAVAQVQLPLMDLLLGRDTRGKYKFRQQIVHRNGSQTIDPDWRETDLSLLVLPMK